MRIDLNGNKRVFLLAVIEKVPEESLPSGNHIPWLAYKTLNRLQWKKQRIIIKKRRMKKNGKGEHDEERISDHMFALSVERKISRRQSIFQTR